LSTTDHHRHAGANRQILIAGRLNIE